MDKEDMILYTVEYYSTIKKNAICSNIDAARDFQLKEVSQTEKDKHYRKSERQTLHSIADM